MFKMFTRVFSKNSKNATALSSIIRLNTFSSTISAEPKNTEIDNSTQIGKSEVIFKPNKIVAAAFASLNHEYNKLEIKTPHTDSKIESAANVDQLLSISEGNGVSRKHALKVVSILSEWSSTGKVQLSEFENDPRFLRLCKILAKPQVNNKITKMTNQVAKSEDLSTVLTVAADEEAAQLIGNIEVPQMVKVVSALTYKKRRSTLLLRTIAYNIAGSQYQLNIKQCSDLLYSLASLNFQDENLLAKIGNDICLSLKKNMEKSAVIGSILTSIGLLKYKNTDLLEALCEWILKKHSICRNQDIFGLLMTLAIVNYVPTNADKLFETISPNVEQAKTGKHTVWLETIWSLVLLNRANAEQISSIFEDQYLIKFQENSSISSKLKLLNIDAYAEHLVNNYNGLRLPKNSVLRNVKPITSKDKTGMIDSVVETMKNFITSEELLKTHTDTGMGFYIDAECLLDSKCKAVPFEKLGESKDLSRVAILVQDFFDMTIGKVEPTGINVLYENLLKAQGYKIISVPYTEFRPKDNLIQRVKYLESKLKSIVAL